MSSEEYPRIKKTSACGELLIDGPIVIEEKVDGAQFCFGMKGKKLWARGKRRELSFEHGDTYFNRALVAAGMMRPWMHDGWSYYAEYLEHPKQVETQYDRTPKHFLMIFDIKTPTTWLMPDAKKDEAYRMGLESVQKVYEGLLASASHLWPIMMSMKPALGGREAEGIVVKNYRHGLFGKLKKT